MKLFEPGRIGNLSVKNRIVMAAMGNLLIELDGRLSQRGIDFYVARARGGVGMIITCGARTRQVEQLAFEPLVDTLVMDSKIYAGRLNELAESAHDYGAKVCLQVTPGQGRNIRGDVLRESGAVAPSPVPAFYDKSIKARELTVEEIEKLTGSFKLAGEIARYAGIDAIEINAHGGYLVDEFMTPLWNKRTDRYGGDLDGRLRFLLDIIGNIRKGAGKDFPVIVKFGLTHYLDGGRQIEEGVEIARRLEAAGVAALDIDSGCHDTLDWTIPPNTRPRGCMVDLAARVKKAVTIPVISVGRLQYPELAEQVLREGKADFIALGRGLLAEPEWANKVKAGRYAEIAPCIGDHEGCRRRIYEGKPISCTVNPACGMERDMILFPAEKKKNVMVIGGGPGGMETAIVAARRGHRVTIYEKASELGGNLIPASRPEFKEDYRDLLEYLRRQVNHAGVEVKLGTAVTTELVTGLKPDAVVVATGSVPAVPAIAGIGKDSVNTAVEVLMGHAQVGETVLVVGGGSVGCETALHLARQGKKVTIIEMLDMVAGDMYLMNRTHMLKLLDESGVGIITGAAVCEITDRGAVTVRGGAKNELEADSMVLACGFTPVETLSGTLADIVPEVYTLGDCVRPRKIADAMREGFRRGRMI